MNEKKKKDSKDHKETDSNEIEKELNEELRQTFPASDPPSRSRPGHERDKDKKNNNE